MEFIKQTWTQIRTQLSQLSGSQRWLILSLVVILLLAGFVMLQYAAAPQMVPITGFAGDPTKVVDRLTQRGIKVRTDGGRIMVPNDQHINALVVLEEGQLLAADTSAAFDDLIKNRSPWLSSELHNQNMLIARQKVLAAIISKMNGVNQADVMVSEPPQPGFGDTHVTPTASVNVVMEPRRQVTRPLVNAIAGLVSGAFARMRPQDVVVIDANRGRQFTVKDESDLAPEDSLAYIKQIEERYHGKISQFLSYCAAIVAVNVQTGPTIRAHVIERTLQSEQPLASEMNKESNRRETASEGEPGVKINVGMAATDGTAAGKEETEAESLVEFMPHQVTKTVDKIERGHNTKFINVSINVPRRFFILQFQGGAAQPDAQDADPDEAFIESKLEDIRTAVEPLIATTDGTGIVRAQMIPDPQLMASIVDGLEPAGGVLSLVSSGWAKPIGITTLALVSLALMFSMVRKATQRQDLPSVEELAGLPPKLSGDDDLVGEAGESDTAIAGVEVDEEEVRSRKIAEQISELVNANPNEASALINRWVTTDE